MEAQNGTDLLVCHISGMPGSGKSFFGSFLKKAIYGISVVDTDTLIEHDTINGNILKALEERTDDPDGVIYDTAWRKIFGTEIEHVIESQTQKTPPPHMLVFVGILDHFGHKSAPVEIPRAQFKFYMDVPADLWLYRFYSRLSTIPYKDDYWRHAAGMIKHSWDIPGSKELLVDAINTKEWHVAHGYEALHTELILMRISTLLKIDAQDLLGQWTSFQLCQ